MKLNITVEGDSPVEIAMLLKGMVAKREACPPKEFDRPTAAEPLRFQWHWPTSSVAQVGDQTFIWYEETGMPGGVEYSLEAAQHAIDARAAYLNQPKAETAIACTDGGRFVEYDVIQDNDFLMLTCYGDCLYVLCEYGVPVWCGHSLAVGRDEAQRRQNKRDGIEPVAEYSQQQPKLPELDVSIVVDVEVEPEPSMLQTKVAGPGFQEPVYEEDTQVTEPQPTRPTDEEGHYWAEGTRCQLKDCNEYLRPAGRKRESGYCAKHRNS